MKKIIYPVQGMHCRSCELLLERNIGKLNGVSAVRAQYTKGVVEVTYEQDPLARGVVESVIQKSGYTVGEAGVLPWITRDAKAYFDLAVAGSVLLLLYLVAKILGVTDFVATSNSAPGYALVALIGLTAGFSTCMALVGGLVLGFSARYSELHPEATGAQRFRPHLFFNAGRVMGYALLGGLIGGIGSAFKISESFLGILVVGVGCVMLFLGVKLIEIFPRMSVRTVALPAMIGRALGFHKEKEGGAYSNPQIFTVGALTFFLPCGFTQAMQLYAISTGSFVQGALIMGIFALGTAPGLLGMGGIAAAVRGDFARQFFKFAGLAVIVFGMVNISNGWTLTGFSFPEWRSSSGPDTEIVAPIEDGTQVVRMREYGRGYSPNQFTVKKGIPVRWVIDATEPYSCASTVIIPALRIGKQLQPGLNTVEFTPPTAGKLRFSCGMGMFGGYFNVID